MVRAGRGFFAPRVGGIGANGNRAPGLRGRRRAVIMGFQGNQPLGGRRADAVDVHGDDAHGLIALVGRI